MKKLILFALSVALLLGGCTADKTGNFELYLTDQPIDGLEQVLITITAIKVQKDDGSITTVWEGERTFDLLLLQDIEERILDVELEQGTYTHVIVVSHKRGGDRCPWHNLRYQYITQLRSENPCSFHCSE